MEKRCQNQDSFRFRRQHCQAAIVSIFFLSFSFVLFFLTQLSSSVCFSDTKLVGGGSSISANFDFYDRLAQDVLLCKEILVQEFYKFKKESNERGRIWTQSSENLNSVTVAKFKVNQWTVKERFDLLL